MNSRLVTMGFTSFNHPTGYGLDIVLRRGRNIRRRGVGGGVKRRSSLRIFVEQDGI